jgi:hypothetical protein
MFSGVGPRPGERRSDLPLYVNSLPPDRRFCRVHGPRPRGGVRMPWGCGDHGSVGCGCIYFVLLRPATLTVRVITLMYRTDRSSAMRPSSGRSRPQPCTSPCHKLVDSVSFTRVAGRGACSQGLVALVKVCVCVTGAFVLAWVYFYEGGGGCSDKSGPDFTTFLSTLFLRHHHAWKHFACTRTAFLSVQRTTFIASHPPS